METTAQPMTKLEHQYLTNINKLEQLTEKLEGKLSTVEKTNTELIEKNKAFESENKKLFDENEALKIECKDTVVQCQEHIDNIEAQHDDFEKQIAELKTQVLPDAEMLFYNAYKADTIMGNAFTNGLFVLTPDYLKETKFPSVFLTDKDFDGITTTYFKLTKEKDSNNYTLTKN